MENKKKQVNKQRNILVIVIASIFGCVVCSGVGYVGIRYAINLQNEGYNKSWNDTTKVELLTSKPSKSIYYEIGEISTSTTQRMASPFYASTDTKVKVYVDRVLFVEEYKKAAKSTNSNISESDLNAQVNLLNSALDNGLESLNEISFDSIELYIKNLDYAEIGVDATPKDNLISEAKKNLLKSGKVYMINLKDFSPQTYFTIEDIGMLCGPLCGSGSIKYVLPNGEVFSASSWIS
jgi:hypothetical protein